MKIYNAFLIKQNISVFDYKTGTNLEKIIKWASWRGSKYEVAIETDTNEITLIRDVVKHAWYLYDKDTRSTTRIPLRNLRKTILQYL